MQVKAEFMLCVNMAPLLKLGLVRVMLFHVVFFQTRLPPCLKVDGEFGRARDVHATL